MRHPDFDDELLRLQTCCMAERNFTMTIRMGRMLVQSSAGVEGCLGADMRNGTEVSAGSCESDWMRKEMEISEMFCMGSSGCWKIGLVFKSAL